MIKYKYQLVMLLVFLVLCNTIGLAQSGPVLPCDDCQQYTKRTVPLNGLWFNPQQSGVGISMELQENLLFGVYYGYDESGASTWFTFLGPLVKSEDPEIMWTVDANLVQFENGTCPNCNYIAPTHTEFTSTLKIKFKHKNYASFSIDDGSEQNIVPIVFAVEQSIDFPEVSSYKVPELAGFWNFNFKVHAPDISSDYFLFSQNFLIGSKSISNSGNGVNKIGYSVLEWYPNELLVIGEIECKTTRDEADNLVGPNCEFFYRLGFNHSDLDETQTFKFPLGGLGAARLFGETSEGHTFEAIKLDLSLYHDK